MNAETIATECSYKITNSCFLPERSVEVHILLRTFIITSTIDTSMHVPINHRNEAGYARQ